MEYQQNNFDKTKYSDWNNDRDPDKLKPPAYGSPGTTVNSIYPPSNISHGAIAESDAGQLSIRTYQCIKFSYLMAGLVLLGGSIAIICIGVIRVKPYAESLSYTDGTCEVVSANYTGKFIGCSCGKNCHSEYPCLRVMVTVTNHGGNNGSGYQALLHETEYGPAECTYEPHCDRDKRTNINRVESYKREYGKVGQRHTCLINPADPARVIRVRSGRDWAIHGMLWPALCIVTSGLILIILSIKYGCSTKIWQKYPGERQYPPPAAGYGGGY